MDTPDLAQTRDHAAQLAERLPPALAPIARAAAKLLEHVRRVIDGESVDVGAALAELPAQELGAFLRAQRQAAELSLRDLARRTGLSVNTVRDVEAGKRTPAAQTIARLVAVPELGLSSLAAPAGAADADRPNAWLLPKYDRGALIAEMRQILNGPGGGRLEQTCLYLDDESAADWLSVTTGSGLVERFRSVPLQEVAAAILRQAPAALDLVALGPGDGRTEVHLATELLKGRAGLDLRLQLLDISHTLLTQAHEHARAELPQQVRVEALHGDFRQLSRYPMLRPARARARRRCFVLLGNTLANVDNEVIFVRECLGLALPGDLFVVDFQTAYTASMEPDDIRAADPAFAVPLVDVFARWFSGPLRRYARGVADVSLGIDLIVDCPVQGSYELDFFADARRAGELHRFHLARARRYDADKLLATFARYGWATDVCFRYGQEKRFAIAVLRRK